MKELDEVSSSFSITLLTFKLTMIKYFGVTSHSGRHSFGGQMSSDFRVMSPLRPTSLIFPSILEAGSTL